jgi:prepilin signal peptidase PulO-like enzyme (type II secretory pathway)
MILTISLFIFIFGTLIGSFLNVVALRYNTGMTLGGRSGCFSCGKTLHWYELVPVVSFFLQRGRCTACKASISWQYPIIEALTGFTFLLVFWRELGMSIVSIPATSGAAGIIPFGIFGTNSIFGVQSMFLFISLFFYWIIFSLLIVILVYDLRHKIIPDGLVYTFCGLALVHLFVNFFIGQEVSVFLWALLAGPLLFLPFFLLWLISRGRWIGLGDGKLALGVGWLFGLSLGASAIAYAFWVGAVVGIVLLVFRTRKYSMKSEIPFAPFIILGVFLVYYFRVDVVSLLSNIQF